MATPVWFDADVYLANKAAQLGVDALEAVALFKNAGWPTDEDSLYLHFVQYGNAEGVVPNSWFKTNEYLQDKAESFFGTSPVTTQQVEAMAKAIANAGMTPWSHYAQYWAEDFAADKSFHNPSNSTDVQKYMEDKLALMVKTDATYTMDKLVKAFVDAGLDPVSHFLAYGIGEGLTMNVAGTGTSFALTTGDDIIMGTAGDDYIYSPEGTLQSPDYVNGGAGDDLFYADVNHTSAVSVVSPTIVDVETILFRAQNINASGGGTNNTTSYFDAEKVSFKDANADLTIGSDNSRNTLRIEDVRWNSNQTTIRFSNTDPGAVDLDVYFDPQHLKSEASTTTGTLVAELIDTVGALPTTMDGKNDPLYDNPYNGFKFSLNGKEHTLDFGAYNHTTDKDPTYGELAAQMQAAIDKNPDLAALGLKVTLGNSFTAKVGIGEHKGTDVTGTQIVITTEKGELTGGNWIASNGLPPTNSTSAQFTDKITTDCPLIVTNVELDNVGRVVWDTATPDCLPDDIINGSEAGDLIIGSMATRGGVERFDVTVDDGSWLSSMSSTNNTLRMITVKGEDIDENGVIGDGPLYIGDWLHGGKDLTVNQNIITWEDHARLLTADRSNTADPSGLNDVAVFDATGYKGDINIGAAITAASFDKYFKSVDGVKYIDKMYAPLADDAYKGAFSYLTGTGDDVINMTVNGAIAADTDFEMVISTGAGDDLVAFRYEEGMSDNQSANQKNLQNVTINTGDGDDTVWFYGDEGGSVKINAGGGNDVIYANQNEAYTGEVLGNNDVRDPDLYNAVYVFNTNDRTINTSYDGATLQNDMAVGNNSFAFTGATVGDALWVTVEFKGHKVSVKLADITSTTNTPLTAEQVNHAIIEAIAYSDVLSNLLVAKDGAGHTLLIESLINGEMSLDDLLISFGSVKADGTKGNTNLDTGHWYDTAFGMDTAGDKYTGNDTTTSQVIVDGGAGDDIIVLGSNGTLNDIVKVGADNGNDVLVGFESGVDQISLSGVLDNTKALDKTTSTTSLKHNSVAISAQTAADKDAGLFTIAEVQKLITDGKIKFGSTDAGTAVIFLQSTDKDGNNVYTMVKLVNGSTITPTILGSYTLDATDGIANALDLDDFIVKMTDEVLRDPVTGLSLESYAGVQLVAGVNHDGATPPVYKVDTLLGSIFGDTFSKISDTTLNTTATTTTGLMNIDGGFGDDTFNVNGGMAYNASAASEHQLYGGAGVDTFNIKSDDTTTAFAVNNRIHGGDDGDIFNITSTDAAIVTSVSGGFFGDGGNDTFNFKSVLNTNITLTTGQIFLVDGGTGTDSAFFTYANGKDTVTTGSAVYTVTTMKDVENVTVGANVSLTVDFENAATVATKVTIDASASNLLDMTNSNTTANDNLEFTITGGKGKDVLIGNAGDDTINGGADDDKITGNGGNDTLTGGSGADTFIFNTKATAVGIDNVVTITDFNHTDDTITLKAGSDILKGVTLANGVSAPAIVGGATGTADATSVGDLAAVYAAIAANTTFNTALVASNSTTTLNAAIITFANGAAKGAYLVINDATNGFNGADDMVICLGTTLPTGFDSTDITVTA